MISAGDLIREIKIYYCTNPFCTVVLYKAMGVAPFSHCPACHQLGRVGDDSLLKEAVV